MFASSLHRLNRAFLLSLLALGLASLTSPAQANSFVEPTKNSFYFLGSGTNWDIPSGTYMLLTVIYDGETVWSGNSRVTGRGGFGGSTLSQKHIKDGELSVKMAFYRTSDNQLLDSKNWSGRLSTGRQGTNYRARVPGTANQAFDVSLQFSLGGYQERNDIYTVNVAY